MNRKLLMIPGPIEFEPDVLNAMGWKTESHVAPTFIERFGRVLRGTREVFRAPSGQPFIVAGSGTLAMEMAAANLVEPGDRVLLVNTGYFGDRYARMLERYGADLVQLGAPVGGAPTLDEVDAALEEGAFKLLVATHVDTSTGVRTDVQGLAQLANKHGVLSIFDGVCATAGERFEQEEWGADVYLTASQKAIGVPPGLALLVASPRALERWEARQQPVASLYLDWGEWLPIMRAYEAERPAYFGTPPINLIYALDVSLGHILGAGMEAVWARHERIGGAFRAAWDAMGLPNCSHLARSCGEYPECALFPGRGGRGGAGAGQRAGDHLGRWAAPRDSRAVFPRRPHGLDHAGRCGRDDQRHRAQPARGGRGHRDGRGGGGGAAGVGVA